MCWFFYYPCLSQFFAKCFLACINFSIVHIPCSSIANALPTIGTTIYITNFLWSENNELKKILGVIVKMGHRHNKRCNNEHHLAKHIAQTLKVLFAMETESFSSMHLAIDIIICKFLRIFSNTCVQHSVVVHGFATQIFSVVNNESKDQFQALIFFRTF